MGVENIHIKVLGVKCKQLKIIKMKTILLSYEFVSVSKLEDECFIYKFNFKHYTFFNIFKWHTSKRFYITNCNDLLSLEIYWDELIKNKTNIKLK